MFKVRWEIWHDSYCKFTAESHNEEILESANISQSYERISSGTFLWLTVYIQWICTGCSDIANEEICRLQPIRCSFGYVYPTCKTV